MHTDLIAESSTTIAASQMKVWSALVSPEAIKEYMFGTTVVSDWIEGSPISWRGEWEGKPYEDKGVILQATPGLRLQYSHVSSLAGLPETPEHYHTVTIELVPKDIRTSVWLSQDNNPTDAAREHAERNWAAMLAGLKSYVAAEPSHEVATQGDTPDGGTS